VGNRNRYARCKGRDRWELFHKDFEGLTHDIFKVASRNAVRELRVELVSKGEWFKPAKGSNSYAKVLQYCLDKTTPAKWTEEEETERNKVVQKFKQPLPLQTTPPPQGPPPP
jgi:hypothetical protein